MSKFGIVCVAATAFVFAVLAAGCGGSDSSSTPTDTAGTGSNERLTAEQWTTYQAAAEPFAAANTALLKPSRRRKKARPAKHWRPTP